MQRRTRATKGASSRNHETHSDVPQLERIDPVLPFALACGGELCPLAPASATCPGWQLRTWPRHDIVLEQSSRKLRTSRDWHARFAQLGVLVQPSPFAAPIAINDAVRCHLLHVVRMVRLVCGFKLWHYRFVSCEDCRLIGKCMFRTCHADSV